MAQMKPPGGSPESNPVLRGMSPSTTPALVLGILSIMLGGCPLVGIAMGIVLGFIGLAHANKAQRDLDAHPALDGAGMVVAGRACSIIGILLGLLQAVLIFGYITAMWLFGVQMPTLN